MSLGSEIGASDLASMYIKVWLALFSFWIRPMFGKHDVAAAR